MEDREENPRIYLGYQPILNRRQNVIGLELLFRQTGQGNEVILDPMLATSRVLAGAFVSINANEFLYQRKAFVNFDRTALESHIIELFPPGKLVVEILETIQLFIYHRFC